MPSEFEPSHINGQWKNPELQNSLSNKVEDAAEKLVGIQSSADLANLLEIPHGVLIHILRADKNSYYTHFEISKKGGGVRSISSPNRGLKILQQKLKPLFEYHYRVKKPVFGFVSGNDKGIKRNAEKHRKKNYIVSIDLESFFDSITDNRIYGVFKAKPFKMGHLAAAACAQICTFDHKLPQGSCTSPILSNFVAASLDSHMIRLSKRFHLTYTRYADDITLSTNKIPSRAIVYDAKDEKDLRQYFIGSVLRNTIENCGFKINEKKFRVKFKSDRQEVTGLTVNEKINVSKKFVRNTRAMIHSWSKDLIEAEKKYFRLQHDQRLIDSKEYDGTTFKKSIYGRLSFIRHIKGEKDSTYLNLCKKVAALDNAPPKFIRNIMEELEMYDVFICHASEDKNTIAIPLYEELRKLGINVFLDQEAIQWGDSIIDKINTALKQSKKVVAILSDNSIEKSWPQKEINAVLSQEINSNETKLLPLIFGNEDEIASKFPYLMKDKLYKTITESSVSNIAIEIKNTL